MSTTSINSFNVGSNPIVVLPANFLRHGAVITNYSDTTEIFLAIGTGAVIGKGIVLMPQGSSYEIKKDNYFNGFIKAIGSSTVVGLVTTAEW